MENDYYKDLDRIVEVAKERLQTLVDEQKVLQENADLILRFVKEHRTQGQRLKPATVNRHLVNLGIVAQRLGKRQFKDTIENDQTYKELLDALSDETKSVEGVRGPKKVKRYSQSSIYDFKKGLKVFFKWINGGEDYPRSVKWISLGGKPRNNLTNDDMVTEDEVLKMVDCAYTQRDKAAIYCLFETCMRISEFLAMRIKDCKQDENGFTITVKEAKKSEGSEGTRKAYVINGSRYLRHWLDTHPTKDNGDSYVWVTTREGNFRGYKDVTKDSEANERRSFKNERMSDVRLRKIIADSSDRAKITKPVNPHNFRRSGATNLKQRKVDSWFIAQVGGWTPDSRVLRDYIKVGQHDTRDAILRAHGVETKKETALASRPCLRCKDLNPPNAEFCGCGQPLTPQAIENSKMELAKTVSNLLMKNTYLEYREAMLHEAAIPNQVVNLDQYQLAGYKAEINISPGSGTSIWGPQVSKPAFIGAEGWIECKRCGMYFKEGKNHSCDGRMGDAH